MAHTVVRATRQPYGNHQILGCQNSKNPEPIDEIFGFNDYVGDNSPHSKIKNDHPIGGVAAYA